jgi:hypothetical protein
VCLEDGLHEGGPEAGGARVEPAGEGGAGHVGV